MRQKWVEKRCKSGIGKLKFDIMGELSVWDSEWVRERVKEEMICLNQWVNRFSEPRVRVKSEATLKKREKGIWKKKLKH